MSRGAVDHRADRDPARAGERAHRAAARRYGCAAAGRGYGARLHLRNEWRYARLRARYACRDARRRGEVALGRSEEHTSELQSLMRISYAVFCLKKKTNHYTAIH